MSREELGVRWGDTLRCGGVRRRKHFGRDTSRLSDCRKRCVYPLAPSARGLRPQAVGERTVRQSEIFRAMARFSSSAPTGHLPRRGRFFDTLGFRLGGRLCLHQFLQYRILHDHPGGRQAEHLSIPHGVPVPDTLPHKDALCRRKPSAAAFIRRDVQSADQP